jgi:hypothetical protein
MGFGFDVAADVDFDWDMQSEFDGDWAGWAKISAATDATLDFDVSGSLTFKTHTSGDVDDDGVDERVRLVAVAEDDPSDPDHVFATWEGDKYSFDQHTCYLLWWEGRQIELLSADCDQVESAVHCVMTRGDRASFACDVCNHQGTCVDCSTKQTVDDCTSDARRELPIEPEPSRPQGGSAGQGPSAAGSTGQNQPTAGSAGQGQPAGGSAGQGQPAGGSPNLAGAGGAASGLAGSDGVQAGSTGTGATAGTAAGGAANGDTGGSTGSGGTTSVSAEWSTCTEQVETIRSEARDCDMTHPLDENTLCSERLSDVNICWLAVAGAGLFTSTCSVLEENLTCGRMFP